MICLVSFHSIAQIELKIEIYAGNSEVHPRQPILYNNQTYQLDIFKLYLTNFEFYNNEQKIASFPESAFLVDFEIDSTKTLHLPIIQETEYDKISFTFGVDSITNTSGAMSGTLDPMHGMYWSWQSGYINCKVEGLFQNSPFEYHIGGYLKEQLAAQLVSLSSEVKTSTIRIQLDALLEEISTKETLMVMSPCSKAVELSSLIANSIQLWP